MADLKISELPLRTRAPGEASSADQVRTSSRAATSSAWRASSADPAAGSAVQVATV